jgi:hypothetical protein
MSAALRYRLAVLFAHLIEGRPEPPRLVRGRAEFLGISEESLGDAAHRLRRRMNVVMGLDLHSLGELGQHLVSTGELGRQDLDP